MNDAKNLARNECSICVVGNKSDLVNDRQVKFLEGARLCQENNLIHFECSALNGENIDEVFTTVAKHIMNKIDNGIIDPSSVVSYGSKKIKEDVVLTNLKPQSCSKSC